MWNAYILECRNGALSTGVTDNLERRFSENKSGKGGHYTQYNRPTKILYSEVFDNKIIAENRESQIKRWSRAKKLTLSQGKIEELRLFSKSRD